MGWLYSQSSLFTLSECLRLVIWVNAAVGTCWLSSPRPLAAGHPNLRSSWQSGFEHGNTHTGPTAASGPCAFWSCVKSASLCERRKKKSLLLTSQLLWEAKGSAWQPWSNSETGNRSTDRVQHHSQDAIRFSHFWWHPTAKGWETHQVHGV